MKFKTHLESKFLTGMYKKIILLCFLILTVTSLNAQRISKIYSGFNGFVLGTTLEMYGTGLEFVDSFNYRDRTEYHYVNRFMPDQDFAGVKFKDVILTFDKENKLMRIELTKIYTRRLNVSPEKQWTEDRTTLIKYFYSQTGIKGKKLKRNSRPSYEWVKGGRRIRLFYQHQAAQNSQDESYGITIVWEREG